MRSFSATNKPGTCLWCGRKLAVEFCGRVYKTPGRYGNGFFCTLSCGFQFAVRFAELGKRLVDQPTIPPF